jgi:hypothetical protein
MARCKNRSSETESDSDATTHQEPLGYLRVDFLEVFVTGEQNFRKITRKTPRGSRKHRQGQTLIAISYYLFVYYDFLYSFTIILLFYLINENQRVI